MRTRIYQAFVSGLVALLIASIAAPGLTMHNCRQFGTRSTQLCACCEAELDSKGGCCSTKPESVAHRPHNESGPPAIESSCCFTSFETPFAFNGQSGSITLSTAPTEHDVARAFPAVVSEIVALHSVVFSLSEFPIRHSSDPPSYLLTHSFRC
jgi:hypothetical protein